MGEVVPARTSPTLHPPSPPTVHQLSQLALWFKHILFMMKRIGRGLNATRALSWKEYLQGNSLTHTVIQQHEHTIKIHNIKTCD